MDKVYFNGKIITMAEDSAENDIKKSPEAILVTNGMISDIGKLSEIKSRMCKKVEMVDLKGKCLMPAFIDPHSHVFMNGKISVCAKLGDCRSFQDIIDTLKKYIEVNNINENGAVLGFGYDHNFLNELAHPDKRVLDMVSTSVPIMILHVSSHLACVNSKALELAGVTDETDNPQGGVIGRMPDGKEPSGYLEEAGMALVQPILAKRVKAKLSSVIAGMQKEYIENGITTVQDGATTSDDFQALKLISALGKLKIDVIAYPLMSTGGVELLHNNSKYCGKYRRHLKIGGYKLVLDGSPQGRSAWMSEPYLGDDTNYCGYPWMRNEQVDEYVKIAISEKKQLLAHCNGDAASEQFLSAYEKMVSEQKCTVDLRPVMIHCQTVRNDQLDRMAKLKMIASIFVGHVYYWGDVHIKNFGITRGNHISPARDALARDVKVTFHQDTPVTKPDMMHSVWCAVNRKSRGENYIGKEQSISVYEALKAITVNGAFQYFEEDYKGTISVGKCADLVVLDKSPLEVDMDEIKNIRVLETIKNGKTIYCRED